MGGPFIDWSSLLRQLSIQVVADRPPTAICPFCRNGKLRLFNDAFLPSHRFSCERCKATGDILRLVEKMTKVPGSEAISKLSELNAEAGNLYKQYLSQIGQNDRAASILLAGIALACKAPPLRLTDVAPAARILSQCGLRVRASLSWIPDTLGQMLGFLTADELERLLRLERPESSTRPLATEHYKVLPASAPGACVVPLWAGPEQPSALHMFWWSDNKYREAARRFGYRGEEDMGFAIHPKAIHSAEPLVLAPTLYYYVRLAVAFAGASGNIPPIAATPLHGSRTQTSSQWLAGRKLTLWTPWLSPEMIRQAIRFNCRIHVAGPAKRTREDFHRYIDKLNVPKFLEESHEKGLLWPEAAARQLEAMPRGEAIDYLRRCELSSTELQLLEQALEPKHRELTEQLRDHAWRHVIVPTRKGSIEQRVGGWYHRTGTREVLVTDAPYRIKDVLTNGKKTTCLVEVFYQGKAYQVTCDGESMDRQPMQSIHAAMLSEHNCWTTYDTEWEKSIGHVANQISPPSSVKRVQRVGIDHSGRALRTTYLKLDTTSGRISPTDSSLYGTLLPQAQDRMLSVKELRQMNLRPKLAWPIAITAAQLYAQITGQRTLQLVISHPSAVRWMRKLAEALGLNIDTEEALGYGAPCIHLFKEQHELSRLFRQNLDWTYPRWISARQELAEWLTMTTPSFCIAEPYTREPLPTPEAAQTAVLQLVAEMCRRTSRQASSPLKAAVAAWKKLCRGCELTGCLEPEMIPSTHPVDALSRMLQRHIDSGQIDLVHKLSAKSLQPQVIYDRSRTRIRVPRPTLARIFERLHLPPWDLDLLSHHMLTHPLFQDQTSQSLRSVWNFETEFLRFPKPMRKVAPKAVSV